MARNAVVKFFTEGFYNGSNKIKLKKVKLKDNVLIVPTSFASIFDFVFAPLAVALCYYSIQKVLEHANDSSFKWYVLAGFAFMFAFSSIYNLVACRKFTISTEGLIQSVVTILFINLRENFPKQALESILLDRKRRPLGGYLLEVFAKPKWSLKVSLGKTNCDASSEDFKSFLRAIQDQLNKAGISLSADSKAYLKEIVYSKE